MKNKTYFFKIFFFNVLLFGIAGYVFIFCFFAFPVDRGVVAGESVTVGLQIVAAPLLEKPTYTVDTAQPETAIFNGYYENADLVYLDITPVGGSVSAHTINADSGGNWEFNGTLAAGDYTSRVQIRTTGGQNTEYSDIVYFTVRALDKPTFTVDVSNEEKAIFKGTYNEGERAFLEVNNIDDETTTYYELNINPPYNWKLEEILEGGDDYYARLRIRNIYGQMSQYSDNVYFHIDAKDAHEDDEDPEEPVTPPEEPVTPPEEPVTPPEEPVTPPEEPVTPPEEPVTPEPGTPILSPVDEGIKSVKDVVKSGSKAVKETTKAVADSIVKIYQSQAVQNLQEAVKENPAAVAVSSMVGMAAASVPMALQLDSFGTLFSALRNGLGLAFLKRKRKQWGMVYDAMSGQPIPGALVSVFNEDGRKLDAVSTDKYGSYAFLVTEGRFRLETQKEGFKFVPNNKSAKSFYSDNYNGEYLDIKDEDLIRANIPMVAEKEIKEKVYRKYLFYIFQAIFYGGFMLSIFAAITKPSILNLAIFTMYAVSGLVNEKVLGRVKWGKTLMPNGKNASFTYIKVRNRENGELISKVISDNTGRYYLILNPGKYNLEAVAIDGSRWSEDVEVLKRKVIDRKIKLQKASAA